MSGLFCLMCGDSSDSAARAAEEYSIHVEGVNLCLDCASRAANAFWKKHSGEWLTWENPPKEYVKSTKQPIPQGLRTKVFERDMYRCLKCGSHMNLTVDHIHPEVLGGGLEPDNLQTLCRSCNSKKGTKNIDYRKKGGCNEAT